MKLTRSLLALAALAAVHSLPAAVRQVTNGGDYFASTPPVAGTLRAAVEGAQAGDTIAIAQGLIVYLQDHLTIVAGQDNLTITGPENGAAEIRTKIKKPRFRENDPGFSQAAVQVLGDGVMIRKVSLRDIALTIGPDTPPPEIQGATVQDCHFAKVSSVHFSSVNGGLIEHCTFLCANRGVGGTGLIDIDYGDGVTVRDCVLTQIAPSSTDTALSVSFTKNVLFENNTLTNGDIYFYPLSGTLRNNRFAKRELDMALYATLAAFGNTGPYLVEGNTCGAMRIHASNFTVRDNTISGHLAGERPPTFTSFFYALNMIAGDNTQPVLIEGNTITGSYGAALSIDAGSPGAVIRDNTISNVDYIGLRVSAESPVEVSENVFERCGNRKLGIPGSFPVPALHLRTVAATVLVRENTFHNSRGAAIVAGDGSPIFQTNRITRGAASGIIFHGGVTPVFMGTNMIDLMGRAGVLVKAGAAVTVEHAIFESNGVAGISVEAGGRVTARDNRFTAQLGPGINVADAVTKGGVTTTARALVDACQFTMNQGAGVLVGKGASCEIAGGSFIDNVGAGIDLAPAGVTPNTKTKQANGDLDFPEQLTFDGLTRMLRGKAEPGALVRLYRTEDNRRRGNPKNGEGAIFVASTTAMGGGDFAIAPGPTREGDLFCFTATRPGAQPVTSEFSENIAVPPSPPIELISVSSDELVGNDQSTVREPSDGGEVVFQSVGGTASTDGRFVVFSSKATNLVNDDTNNESDVFVRDRATGTTERVNVSSAGEQAFRSSFLRSGGGVISADGRYVVFGSNATNLVAGDGNGSGDIFLRDRETDTTFAVTDPTEQPGGGFLAGGWDPAMSADGGVVAFVTTDPNFIIGDTNQSRDILIWTRSSGAYERVSLLPGGGEIPFGMNGNTGQPRLDGDGSVVVFLSGAAIVAGDTNGALDIYLRDRTAGTTELVSRNSAGMAVGGTEAAITPDGRFVAFQTNAQLVAADTNADSDIYVLDRNDGTMRFASPPPAGGYNGGQPGRKYPTLSNDGRYVAFQGEGRQEPPDSLTTLDPDIYVHDLQLGVTIKVSLDPNGIARSGRLPAITPDGASVLFQTFSNKYDPADTNSFINDLYVRTLSAEDFPEP